MKIKTETLVALLALTLTAGCVGMPYPQYTGTFELDTASAKYPEKSLLPEFNKQLPSSIKISTELVYSGGSFVPYLTFTPLAQNKDEASGKTFRVSMTSLARPYSSSGEANTIYAGHSFVGPIPGHYKGKFCYVNYYYQLYLNPELMTPKLSLLDEIYLTHSKVGDQEVGIQSSQINEAEIAEKPLVEWEKQIAHNGGMTLGIEISKVADLVVSGCTDGLPTVETTGSISAKYKSYVPEEQKDPRSGALSPEPSGNPNHAIMEWVSQMMTVDANRY